MQIREQEQVEGPAFRVYLTGGPGTGKSVLARKLESMELDPGLVAQGVRNRYAIQTRQLLKWHGYAGENRLREMRDYHLTQRLRGHAYSILKPLEELKSGLYTIDALRHPQDLKITRSFPKLNGLVLGLKAPLSVCHDRTINDTSDEKHTQVLADMKTDHINPSDPAAIARAHERAWDLEMEEMWGDSRSGDISACLKMADFIIDANAEPDEVYEQAAGHITTYIEEQCALRGLVTVTSD